MKIANDFVPLLIGKDLRNIRANSIVVQSVRDQFTFDGLFSLMFHHERPLAMRAAEAVERITRRHKAFLTPHKDQLLGILKTADRKELKWHIAQLIPRVNWLAGELNDVWHILTFWARNPHESKIIRANALQALAEIAARFPERKADFERTMKLMEREPIPSIQARIRKLADRNRVSQFQNGCS
jgi:hypothetical protein